MLVVSIAPATACGRTRPSPIAVPRALRAVHETIEPSGVVWVAPLDRYLVVSDDTGPRDERHAPWLLAMDRQGRFDAEPVRIIGLDELNDAESICPGPHGTFFLVTSHSPNRKGKTHAARRMLLLLRLAGRALSIAGQVDLTTARDADGHGLLAIAGLPTDGRLDIEGITFHDGALLIGLKSPLTTEGSAVVLRMADAEASLVASHIPDGSIKRDRAVSLKVEGADHAPIAQGIADLLARSDGSLLLVGNSPKGMPSDGGGALYRLPAGARDPILVERFTGLKPEGLTISEDGKSLVVVFDNDARPPLWLRLPLSSVERP